MRTTQASLNQAFVYNGASNISTSSTSFVDVPGSSLSPLTLNNQVTLVMFMMGYGYNDSAISSNLGDWMQVIVYDSFTGGSVDNVIIAGNCATNVQIVGPSTNFTLTTGDQLISRISILSAAAGTHNYKLQYQAVNGGVAHLDAWEVGYILLGNA